MGRWTLFTSTGGSPTRCHDNLTGTDYPASPCPPRSRGARRGIGSGMRNFTGLNIQEYTQPSTIIPVAIGAAVGWFVGARVDKWAAKNNKLGALKKARKPVLIIAGIVAGAMAGKYIAGRIEASNVEVKAEPADQKNPVPPTVEDITMQVQ